ncbi:MAG: biopolymer transporter ExbD [Candidatus Cloacimonetes bacterium]|nr:biopolymer transporter ExbD [Candidatus Cloacimonadota bacterium]
MAYGPSKNRKLSKREPKEPNLIPIMNLFIVIIPMLMTIMVSVHLAMLEITLPTTGSGGATEQAEVQPPVRIVLALYSDRFEVKVGEDEEITTIPKRQSDSAGEYDFVKLDEILASLAQENQNQDTVELLPAPDVKYDILLRAIDLCKNNGFPSVKYLTTSTKLYRKK